MTVWQSISLLDQDQNPNSRPILPRKCDQYIDLKPYLFHKSSW